MHTQDQPPTYNAGGELLLRIATWLTLPVLFLWPFVAMMAAFLGDAPGALDSWVTSGLLVTLLCYPAPIVVGLWMYRSGVKQKDRSKRLRGVLLCYSPLVVFAFFLWANQALCGGEFVCEY